MKTLKYIESKNPKFYPHYHEIAHRRKEPIPTERKDLSYSNSYSLYVFNSFLFGGTLNNNKFDDNGHSKSFRQEVEDLERIYLGFLMDYKLSRGNKIAILCSNRGSNGKYHHNSSRFFKFIGSEIKSCLKRQGICDEDILLIPNVSNGDFEEVLNDLDISSMWVLGHSTFSTFATSDGGIDFFRLANMTSHLKRGYFVHLGCGNYIQDSEGEDIPISLGCFVVSDRNLLFGKNDNFNNNGGLHQAAQLLPYYLHGIWMEHQERSDKLRESGLELLIV